MDKRRTTWSEPSTLIRFAAVALIAAVCPICVPTAANATPANRIGMERYFERFLTKKLNACTTCHLPLAAGKSPDSLQNFPHNTFGARLAALGEQLRSQHKRSDIGVRLKMAAAEDSDGDGVDNLSEILLGRSPGDSSDTPSAKERLLLPGRKTEFNRFLASYRWQPFESVHAPPIPRTANSSGSTNPIDAFLAVQYRNKGLTPRQGAPRAVLLRRVTLDLTGLSPTPEEIRSFLADHSPTAYENVVNRLLASPRHGERWARHWMDVWRYSDWAGWADGNQIRDSKPFIWRWRDWIVESLNSDKGYDRMLQEMLAADELCPEDQGALRATGFLVRNFKLLSREQWLEDTMNHTSRAFLGLTMHCAKCHNHMYDPVTQADYYRMRAVFEPHNVRTIRVPGQPDTSKDGLVQAFDADPKAPTYLFVRGDERNPDKSRTLAPGVPASLGGELEVKPVILPSQAVNPDRREFVIQETLKASSKLVSDAESALSSAEASPLPSEKLRLEHKLAAARARHSALVALLAVEAIEDKGLKGSEQWVRLAKSALVEQRKQAVLDAEQDLEGLKTALRTAEEKVKVLPATAAKAASDMLKAEAAEAAGKIAPAEKLLATARTAMTAPVTTAYTPRATTSYPAESSGRRLAFAKWLTDRQNPLAARVAVNHVWARHFGQGLVPSTSDFGRNGQPPSNPELLDWLAAHFMANGWSMKELHRLIVTSRAYRLSSTSEAANAKRDPDDVFLWRYPSKRMESECVRDNILFTSGHLDETRGGPDLDQNLALTSQRRSIYLRTAAEKQSEFIQVFDGASVTECYERRPTVMPQQALALANSELTQRESRYLAAETTKVVGTDNLRFVKEAFLRVLARPATDAEAIACSQFLTAAPKKLPGIVTTATVSDADSAIRARQNLVLVLFNHNDFVTIR